MNKAWFFCISKKISIILNLIFRRCINFLTFLEKIYFSLRLIEPPQFPFPPLMVTLLTLLGDFCISIPRSVDFHFLGILSASLHAQSLWANSFRLCNYLSVSKDLYWDFLGNISVIASFRRQRKQWIKHFLGFWQSWRWKVKHWNHNRCKQASVPNTKVRMLLDPSLMSAPVTSFIRTHFPCLDSCLCITWTLPISSGRKLHCE